MAARTLVALTVLLALGCGGGASVDPWTHLQPVCEASSAVPLTGELVALDLPAEPLPDGVLVELDAAGTRVGWRRAADERELRDLLVEEAATREERARHAGEPVPEKTALVGIAPDVPARRLGEVLRAAHGAGLGQVDLAVWSRESLSLPAYLDGDYASELRGRLDTVPPEHRQSIAAKELDALVRACPGAQEVMAAVAHVSAERRCELFARGLGEALPVCLLTDADRVITAVHVLGEPPSSLRPAAIRLRLDPAAPPLAIDPDTTWALVAAQIAARDGDAVWMP